MAFEFQNLRTNVLRQGGITCQIMLHNLIIYRRRLANIPMVLTSFKRHTVQVPYFQCQRGQKIIGRTTDKTHRAFIRTLEREQELYHKRNIILKGTLRHLLVQMHKETDGNVHHIRFGRPYIPQLKSCHKLLEPLLFLIINLLHLGNSSKIIGFEEINTHLDSIVSVISKFKLKKNKNKITVEENFESKASELSIKLLKWYGTKDEIIDTDTEKLLAKSLICFQMVNRHVFKNQYEVEKDLAAWIDSITAASVSNSCTPLSYLSNIPPFIITDVILRTPGSHAEYELQVDLWNQYIIQLAIYYRKNTTILKKCLKNLIFYGIQFAPMTLPHLVSTTLYELKNKKHGYEFSFPDSKLLSDFIWELIYNYIRETSDRKNTAISDIIRAQEIIVSYLSGREDKSSHFYTKLPIRAQMGIVLAIRHLSGEKSDKLFKISLKEMQKIQEITKDDLAAFHFTKILLSYSTEDLLPSFNQATMLIPHSSLIWLGFIRKLFEFDILSDKRAKTILKSLVAMSDKILITKDMLYFLSLPICTLSSMDECLSILRQEPKDGRLLSSNLAYLMPKYMKLLYDKSHSKNESKGLVKLPDEIAILIKHGMQETDRTEIHHFQNPIDCARLIYNYAFKSKKTNLVGLMLRGEAYTGREDFYKLYKDEIENNNVQIDENCLLALIIASTKRTSSDRIGIPVWNHMYAPQIAIHEFKNHVQSPQQDQEVNEVDSNSKIFPSNKLWLAYIRMLSQYGYTSELSIIIHWWGEIKFKPSYKILMALLCSLPVQFAERYIKHYEKLRNDKRKAQKHFTSASNYNTIGDSSDYVNPIETLTAALPGVASSAEEWPWPTIHQLESFKESSSLHKRG